jgi:hypothetical protein
LLKQQKKFTGRATVLFSNSAGSGNMAINNKKHNYKELNLSLSESEEIIDRLKEALNVKSDGQLASHLGISRQNIGAARKRDDVPPGWIHKVAELSGYSMDWLRFGHGPKIRMEYSTKGSISKSRLANPESAYKLQVSWQPRSIDELQPDEDNAGFGVAVEMLAKIYSSGDKLLISTINANMRAFCEAIDRQQREQNSSAELANLKNRLTSIEKQLHQTKPDDK